MEALHRFKVLAVNVGFTELQPLYRLHRHSQIPGIDLSLIHIFTQGMFVGAVADNFDERIEQKIFHAEIVVDNEQVKRETARYVKIPQIIDFTDKDGNDTMQQQIDANYYRIKNEVRQIVADEIGRIKADPELSHLIKDK